ncbi:MAG: rane-associated lipoprotein involved in thiamine biosynthesis [Paenibacillaceae bacterium]|nr:rane-associated lipoprotein involved in thiamine biosynthesis [Paenibacillaceae bacterium]
MLQAQVAQSADFGMNTEILHRVFGEHAEEAVISVKAELKRLEHQLSRFVPGSEISRINQAAGKETVTISPETYEVLSGAIRFSQISQGLFDISIGPLVDLWDYKHAIRAPEETRIQQVLPLVNFHDLIMDTKRQAAGLRTRGQSIDLGGIGKGYAGDCCIRILQQYGIVSAFVSIGGNVSVLGNKPDHSPWRVGIRHPRRDCLMGMVEATHQAVVTSGDYERYFVDQTGKRQHHILNPTTGRPAESGLISVTVVADSALTADALSTAIFVAGMERGLGFLAQVPGAEAVLVDKDQRVFITRGLKGCCQTAQGIRANLI